MSARPRTPLPPLRLAALVSALVALLAALLTTQTGTAGAATGTVLRNDTGLYPRAVRLAYNGSANGRVLSSVVTFSGNNGLGAVYESTDSGASFRQVGTVGDPEAAGGQGLCCSTLFELPRAIGNLPARHPALGGLGRPGRDEPADGPARLQEQRRGPHLELSVHHRDRGQHRWPVGARVLRRRLRAVGRPLLGRDRLRPQPEADGRPHLERHDVDRTPRHRRQPPGLRPARHGGRPQARQRHLLHVVRDLRGPRPVPVRRALPDLARRLGLVERALPRLPARDGRRQVLQARPDRRLVPRGRQSAGPASS